MSDPYVYFNWTPPNGWKENLRPMFSCQEDWDALLEMAKILRKLMDKTEVANGEQETGKHSS